MMLQDGAMWAQLAVGKTVATIFTCKNIMLHVLRNLSAKNMSNTSPSSFFASRTEGSSSAMRRWPWPAIFTRPRCAPGSVSAFSAWRHGEIVRSYLREVPAKNDCRTQAPLMIRRSSIAQFHSDRLWLEATK